MGRPVRRTDRDRQEDQVHICKTSEDVATRLVKAIAESDAGVVFDSGSLKVGENLDRWLDAVRDTVRQRTWQRHEQVVRLHLKPVLGNVRLDRLSALQ